MVNSFEDGSTVATIKNVSDGRSAEKRVTVSVSVQVSIEDIVRYARECWNPYVADDKTPSVGVHEAAEIWGSINEDLISELILGGHVVGSDEDERCESILEQAFVNWAGFSTLQRKKRALSRMDAIVEKYEKAQVDCG